MPKTETVFHQECLTLLKTLPTSRQLNIHPDSIREDGFDFDFLPSVLSSERVEFDLSVNAVEKYPYDHDVTFSLRSSPPHRDEEKELLDCLSKLYVQGMSIKDVVKIVETSLTLNTKYNAKSFVVPDDRTIVVAVLGSSSFVDDDWSTSDFCLLYRALGGTAKQEVWLTCDSLKDYADDHGAIIHGSPREKPSHIVFDATDDDFTTFVDKTDIASDFLNRLQMAALNANCGDRILVVTVAHGCEISGELAIGSSYVSRDMVEYALAGVANDVEISIMTTACYSGIWAIPFANSTSTVLTKTVSVSDLANKTVHSPSNLFQSYSNRVINYVSATRKMPPSFSYSPVLESQQTADILGGSSEVATLFRIGAVFELPKEANFAPVALSVGTFTQKTASHAGPWTRRAQLLYKILDQRSPGLEGRVDNIPISRFAKRVQGEILSEEKCEELARRVWTRFRIDEQAQRIVTILCSRFARHDLPRITEWDWDYSLWKNAADYSGVLQAVNLGKLEPTHHKPNAFIKWTATQCNATPAELSDIISLSLAPPRAASWMKNRDVTGIPMSCSLKSIASIETIIGRMQAAVAA